MDIKEIYAHSSNYNKNVRSIDSIEYIVIHYTGNTNDTAEANCRYFQNPGIKSSAHYFCRGKTICQSVPLEHAAYAVGLGGRKEPYEKVPMWKKITNNNSVSIELCGSQNSREADDETKRTAAKLCAALMQRLGLSIKRVYRHYDVTGKWCPYWAVEKVNKWNEMLALINLYYTGKEDDDMAINERDYEAFKEMMRRYSEEVAASPSGWSVNAMAWAQDNKLIMDGKPNSPVTRAELATVLQRFENRIH